MSDRTLTISKHEAVYDRYYVEELQAENKQLREAAEEVIRSATLYANKPAYNDCESVSLEAMGMLINAVGSE